MKLLLETLRKLILEEVCADATARIQQGLDEIEKRNLVIRVDIFTNGYDIKLLEGDSLVGEFEVSTSKRCPAYITMFTDLDSRLQGAGIGAVMYDVAIEVATKLGGHLTCDRGSVSEDAKPMWRYYNASNDYEELQMDTRNGHFTPDNPVDDCRQTIFHRDTGTFPEDPSFKEEFMASPFTKGFKKKRITTIPCLGDRYRESS